MLATVICCAEDLLFVLLFKESYSDKFHAKGGKQSSKSPKTPNSESTNVEVSSKETEKDSKAKTPSKHQQKSARKAERVSVFNILENPKPKESLVRIAKDTVNTVVNNDISRFGLFESRLTLFFTAYVSCSLRLFKLKTKGKTI